ncbi:hypothetical protein FBU30_006383, partial [Linnemannia zychae]
KFFDGALGLHVISLHGVSGNICIIAMSKYDSEQLSWNTAHTINRQGQYCYCGHDRRLDELSLQCKGCHNWFHASCIEVPLGHVVPFITNYKFLCKSCVVKPVGRNQQNQEPKEPGSVPEFFERVTAGWKEICATTIANLIVQEYLKEARQYKGSGPSRDHPSEENIWSVNADYMDWKEYRYYFNKKDHILPYVDRHWKALCTDRSRTTTWWATLGSCLYISKDVFEATDEQARSASSDFCLTKANLWNIKPGHIASHQSSSSRSQPPKTQREGKRKAHGSTGDDGGSKRTPSGKSEKKSKNAGSSHQRGGGTPATPPVNSQATYIPLPNTVVSSHSGNSITPFSTSNEHPYNRHRFKYVTCEPDPLLQYMLYRQTANPILGGVHLCREDMSPYMFIDDECMTISTEKGFRMARANCGVREGQWYYEVTIDRGGEPRFEGRDGAHVRLGWARREATLQAPVGFDAYSYGIRDTTGEKVHMSRVTPFGEPFKTGDVIGLYISLPPDGNEKTFFKHRRLRRSFYFKGQLYFESVDYSPTKRYIEMAEYEATPVKTNIDKPVPPPIIPGSKIIVYKNGVCQGVMWQDLFAILPIEQNAKEQDQLRFDDGTLGYYPCISVYRNGTATANFGPDFKYPPSKDPEAEAENREITAEHNVWRPMSERWEEKLIEECLIDLVDEVELWVSEQAAMERQMEVTTSNQGGRHVQSRLQEYDQSEDDYQRSHDRSSESRMERSRASEDRDLDDADRDVDMGTPAEREMTEDRMDDDGDDQRERDTDREDRQRERQGRDSHRRHHDDDYSGDDRSQQDMEMHSRYDDDDYDARRGDQDDDRRHSGHIQGRDEEGSDDDDRQYD